ncbi:lantibiotic dehydratase [Actinoplanes regularis]|uniref:lantibiotic dehydratase n=1 Tax=Actinoplanes regularis TaxID=52697 RepID=UPI001EF2FC18|nr:lantibiotic dehydratase [Actinoplanes regularis]
MPLDLAANVNRARAWLAGAWADPRVAEAITLANPDLAARTHQLLHTPDSNSRDIHRAASATMSYLVRWQRRATPFGLFAGVATAAVGPAQARFGDQHDVVVRADGEWLTRVLESLEQHHDLRRRLSVVANNDVVVRGDRAYVACRPRPGQSKPVPLRETSTRYTRIVQAALTHAARPIPFAHLAAALRDLLRADGRRVDALLHGLIDGNILLTDLRPPMTASSGLAHVNAVLLAVNADDLPEVAEIAAGLQRVHAVLARHNASTERDVAADLRSVAAEVMIGLAPPVRHPLAVDVRLDAAVSLPRHVIHEASQAAGLLLRLSTQPFGSQAWVDYHVRFRNRYGPGALVPVRDLVADSGLGYPHGYLGTPDERPTWRIVTERDVHLMRLIQEALLDGDEQIVLTDADIRKLTVGDPSTAVPPARVELGVTVHAASTEALDRGDFELRIIGAPRTPTSMAGRFAYLLPPAHREELTRSYTTATDGKDDVIAVQVSFPPRRVHNQNVVRVGRLVPTVVALSEHPHGDTIDVDDLAVTADADQLYLIRRSTGQRVAPYLPHALDLRAQTPPLARFIAEVAEARSAVFGPFDLGAAARKLPYTPRIRYGRTVLSPARWLLHATDLEPSAADNFPDEGAWETALQRWRQRWRVPAQVIACQNDLRLPLDLESPADRRMLRMRLERAGQLEVREDGPADGNRWIRRAAEFVIPMALEAPSPRALPHTDPPGEVLRPGDSALVHARLAGNPARFDELLVSQLPALVEDLSDVGIVRWWVRRHRDLSRPEAKQHLALLIRLKDACAYGEVAARLAASATDLQTHGLPADLTLTSYYEHPGRYGYGAALDAAEQVFFADTTAAITQLRMAQQTGLPAQALAATSMAQLAASFGPDPITGLKRLLQCLDRQTAPVDRKLSETTRQLADPSDDYFYLRALDVGNDVAAAWQARDTALHSYHDHLLPQRDPAGVLRTLLHEHHIRAVGIDPETERTTGHLTRVAAMRALAAAGAR